MNDGLCSLVQLFHQVLCNFTVSFSANVGELSFYALALAFIYIFNYGFFTICSRSFIRLCSVCSSMKKFTVMQVYSRAQFDFELIFSSKLIEFFKLWAWENSEIRNFIAFFLPSSSFENNVFIFRFFDLRFNAIYAIFFLRNILLKYRALCLPVV